MLTYYELDLGLNHVVHKWSEATDPRANLLGQVPGGQLASSDCFDSPSGVLVCCEDHNLPTCGCSSTPSSNTFPKASTESSLTQLSITHPQIQLLWPKSLVSSQNLGLRPKYNMWSKRDQLPNKGLQFYFSWVSFFYQIDFFPVDRVWKCIGMDMHLLAPKIPF